MAQLHCYVPDAVAEQLRHKAGQAQLSVSKYLSQLVKRDVTADQWPEGYAELFDQWQGKALRRGSQGDYEKRLEIE
jgi:hypothetical protein